MTAFEYLSVALSFVVGLGVTGCLAGRLTDSDPMPDPGSGLHGYYPIAREPGKGRSVSNAAFAGDLKHGPSVAGTAQL